MPEFNPFKYDSFPVNAARQSSLIARPPQEQIAQNAREGRLTELPPILTFQLARIQESIGTGSEGASQPRAIAVHQRHKAPELAALAGGSVE